MGGGVVRPLRIVAERSRFADGTPIDSTCGLGKIVGVWDSQVLHKHEPFVVDQSQSEPATLRINRTLNRFQRLKLSCWQNRRLCRVPQLPDGVNVSDLGNAV